MCACVCVRWGELSRLSRVHRLAKWILKYATDYHSHIPLPGSNPVTLLASMAAPCPPRAAWRARCAPPSLPIFDSVSLVTSAPGDCARLRLGCAVQWTGKKSATQPEDDVRVKWPGSANSGRQYERRRTRSRPRDFFKRAADRSELYLP